MKPIIKFVAYFLLKSLPLFRFAKLNAFLFKIQGYNIDPTVRIYSSAQIRGNVKVNIGKYTFIGHETLIIGGDSSISIGNHCDISSRVSIVSGTHEIDMLRNRSAGFGYGKNIIIEDGVWVGFGSVILPGVTIGEKAIIGAGSIVNKDIPRQTIAYGNPCISRKKWNSITESFENIIIK